MKTKQNTTSGGQALVVLLFYMVIAITVTTTAVFLGISNSLTTMQTEEGNHALEIAESGIENALLRLLRDPSYIGGTLTDGDMSATITVSGGETVKTIASEGVVGNFSRTVEVSADITGGILTIISWQER